MSALAAPVIDAPTPPSDAEPPAETGAKPKPVTFSMASHRLLEDKGISPSDKLILLGMLRYGYSSGVCTASNDTIGDACGLNGRTVSRRLPELSKWATVVYVEPSRANPTGREIHLDWTKDLTRHPQKRKMQKASGGVDKLSTPGGRQVVHRIKTLPLATKEKEISPLIPPRGAGSGKEKEGSLSRSFQRQRNSSPVQAVAEPANDPVVPSSASITVEPQPVDVPPASGSGVHYTLMKTGTVRVNYMHGGKWAFRILKAATVKMMRADLDGLAHDYDAVAKWIADYEAQRPAQAGPLGGAQGIVDAENKDSLYEQCAAKNIDAHRIASIMGGFRKGGKFKETAIEYVNPLTIWFMKEQGGEALEFAKMLERDGVTTSAASADGFTVPKRKIDHVLKIAAGLIESRSEKLVDDLATGLEECFGDDHSRGGFCQIGCWLKDQEINLIEFRDALEHSLKLATQAVNPAAMFRSKLKQVLRHRYEARRRAMTPVQSRQTA